MLKHITIKDVLVLFLSMVCVVGCVLWTLSSNAFGISLASDTKLIWHLIRSSGIVAYLLMTVSVIWGMVISGKLAKEWSAGGILMTVHSTISWLVVIMSLVHALLLLLDDYFTYTLGDIFIPFMGEYRPIAVGLGTVAFWGIWLISLSFPFKKRLGHRNWKWLHYGSYIAFLMVSAHGIFAGTDGNRLGFQILIGLSIVVVVMLLGIRMGKGQASAAASAKSGKSHRRQAVAHDGQ